MNTAAKTPELSDDLSDLIGAPLRQDAPQVPASYNGGRPEGKLFQRQEPQTFTKPCDAPGCRRGKFISNRSGRVVGNCFRCHGTGQITTKTDTAKRAAAKASKVAQQIEAFKAEYPDVWAWMDGSTFEPAIQMLADLGKYGSLFPHRIEFARRMIAKLAEKRAAEVAERTERETQAQAVNITALEDAFAKAAATSKRVSLWIGTVKIKPATGKPGVLYVVDKSADQYLGKVQGGKFIPSRDGRAREAEMLKILQDPKGAAIEHGKLTGSCAVCSRELTDPNSVAAGIGPICAAKMGW